MSTEHALQSSAAAAARVAAIDRFVAAEAHTMIGDLTRAVSIPSVNPRRLEALPHKLRSRAEGFGTGGERAFQEFFGTLASEKLLSARVAATPEPDRPNLEVTLGSRRDVRSLLLNGHCDVVPAVGDGWRSPAFTPEVVEGSLVGRGCADAKGSLVAMLEAMWVVRSIVDDEIGCVTLTSVVDEEAGGSGTRAWIDDMYRTGAGFPDAAIVGEPTNLDVCPATRGARSFRLHTAGTPAHAGEAYLGVNAVDEALAYIEAMREVHREASKLTDASLWPHVHTPCVFNLGVLRGGDSFASVPDRCVAEGVVGWIPPLTLEDMSSRIEDAVRRVAASRPVRMAQPQFEWTLIGFEASASATSHPLVTDLLGAARLVRATSVRGLSAGTDMRHLVNLARIPTVNFGPGSMSEGHGPNESLPIHQFLDAVRILSAFILSWCLAPKKASIT